MTTRPDRSAGGAREKLITAAKKLSKQVDALSFAEPVHHVYNPLAYAWKPHRRYLSMVNDFGTRIVFLGMNPGPWGMAQTGVPFGEVQAAKEWLGIDEPVGKPVDEHPKRLVEGFACQRSEVSGRRLWGLFSERFGTAENFFDEHFVVNYCPLVFMEQSARNRTPDKLPANECAKLDAACDQHLSTVLETLKPQYAVGVGVYAENCLRRVTTHWDHPMKVARILHPSPASPAANRDWAGQATGQLIEAGVWR